MYRLYCTSKKDNKQYGIKSASVYTGLIFGDLKDIKYITMKINNKELVIPDNIFCQYFDIGSRSEVLKQNEPW